MKKKLLFSALILVLLCVIFIFLGLRQNAAPAGSTASQDNKEPITATLAVCGDIMSHSPQTNDAYDAATDTYSYLPCFQSVSKPRTMPWPTSKPPSMVPLTQGIPSSVLPMPWRMT